jgi:peptidoglycan/LPS O-acetylase OafA/YrhL
MNKSLLTKKYYPALDGIRGVAILLVIIYHNFNFIGVSYFGWLGVDLFFVLSGFLITEILLSTIGQKHFLRNFYARRILRIFPLYYTTLILFIIVLPLIFKQSTLFDYPIEHQAWFWTFLQNWLFIFNPDLSSTILHHYWSLAVEEQFYLAWPFIILLFKKPKPLLIFITVVLFSVLMLRLYLWNQEYDILYFNLYTFTRIDGICIGCMVALVQRMDLEFIGKRTTVIVLSFAGLNLLFDFINQQYNFYFPYLALVGYTTFAMLFGLLVNEATIGGNKWVNLVFDNHFLKFFGRISFGLYILHWPIYVMLRPFIFNWWQHNFEKFATPASSLIPTILAILISVLSYYYFERRFLQLKKQFSS